MVCLLKGDYNITCGVFGLLDMKCVAVTRVVCFSDLIHCTNEMNVNVPQLADTLFERTANSSWVVVFKALITTHHLMMYGNEVSIHAPALVGFIPS